jgi:hypothetical protein
VAPWTSQVACALYGLLSGALLLVLALWAVNACLDYVESKPRKV